MTDLICIVCPKGCHLKVDEENGYKAVSYTHLDVYKRQVPGLGTNKNNAECPKVLTCS